MGVDSVEERKRSDDEDDWWESMMPKLPDPKKKKVKKRKIDLEDPGPETDKFTEEEMKVLLEEVAKREEALFGDFKEDESPNSRWGQWVEVADKVNDVSIKHRNVEQVRIKWFEHKDPANRLCTYNKRILYKRKGKQPDLQRRYWHSQVRVPPAETLLSSNLHGANQVVNPPQSLQQACKMTLQTIPQAQNSCSISHNDASGSHGEPLRTNQNKDLNDGSSEDVVIINEVISNNRNREFEVIDIEDESTTNEGGEPNVSNLGASENLTGANYSRKGQMNAKLTEEERIKEWLELTDEERKARVNRILDSLKIPPQDNLRAPRIKPIEKPRAQHFMIAFPQNSATVSLVPSIKNLKTANPSPKITAKKASGAPLSALNDSPSNTNPSGNIDSNPSRSSCTNSSESDNISHSRNSDTNCSENLNADPSRSTDANHSESFNTNPSGSNNIDPSGSGKINSSVSPCADSCESTDANPSESLKKPSGSSNTDPSRSSNTDTSGSSVAKPSESLNTSTSGSTNRDPSGSGSINSSVSPSKSSIANASENLNTNLSASSNINSSVSLSANSCESTDANPSKSLRNLSGSSNTDPCGSSAANESENFNTNPSENNITNSSASDNTNPSASGNINPSGSSDANSSSLNTNPSAGADVNPSESKTTNPSENITKNSSESNTSNLSESNATNPSESSIGKITEVYSMASAEEFKNLPSPNTVVSKSAVIRLVHGNPVGELMCQQPSSKTDPSKVTATVAAPSVQKSKDSIPFPSTEASCLVAIPQAPCIQNFQLLQPLGINPSNIMAVVPVNQQTIPQIGLQVSPQMTIEHILLGNEGETVKNTKNLKESFSGRNEDSHKKTSSTRTNAGPELIKEIFGVDSMSSITTSISEQPVEVCKPIQNRSTLSKRCVGKGNTSGRSVTSDNFEADAKKAKKCGKVNLETASGGSSQKNTMLSASAGSINVGLKQSVKRPMKVYSGRSALQKRIMHSSPNLSENKRKLISQPSEVIDLTNEGSVDNHNLTNVVGNNTENKKLMEFKDPISGKSFLVLQATSQNVEVQEKKSPKGDKQKIPSNPAPKAKEENTLKKQMKKNFMEKLPFKPIVPNVSPVCVIEGNPLQMPKLLEVAVPKLLEVAVSKLQEVAAPALQNVTMPKLQKVPNLPILLRKNVSNPMAKPVKVMMLPSEVLASTSGIKKQSGVSLKPLQLSGNELPVPVALIKADNACTKIIKQPTSVAIHKANEGSALTAVASQKNEEGASTNDSSKIVVSSNGGRKKSRKDLGKIRPAALLSEELGELKSAALLSHPVVVLDRLSVKDGRQYVYRKGDEVKPSK